jgi:ABC-type phosphate transport system substrate-binding protein
MTFKLKSVPSAWMAVAFLAPLAMPAFATPPAVSPVVTTPSAKLIGGGATLPAIAYAGKSWIQTCSGSPAVCTANNPAARLTSSADSGSLFGEFTANSQLPQVVSTVALGISPTTAKPLTGLGYAVGDVLSLVGGAGTGTTQIKVTSITKTGGINTFTLLQSATYTTLPTQTASGTGTATVDTTSGATGKNARFTFTAAASTVYTAYPSVSYCQTGSGTGRKMLLGTYTWVDPNGSVTTVGDASQQCGDYGSNTTASNETSIIKGFGAPSGVTYPNFAASDVPLAASDIHNYEANTALVTKTTQLVQYPSVAASIAIGFQNSHAPKGFTLSEQQICGIFAGTITDWHTLNTAFPSQPITVVYRNDGSGTSFNFSNHLANVCPTALGPNGVAPTTAGPSFLVNQTFYSATSNAAPAGAIGASGNGAIVAKLQTTPASIGYVESEDAATREALAGGVIGVAKVSEALGTNPGNNLAYAALDPLVNFHPTFALPAGSLAYDTVLNTDSNGNLLSPATLAIGNTGTGSNQTNAQTQAGCVAVVAPASYAKPVLTSTGDYSTYPIVAVTYLMAYNTGNGADAVNIQSLLSEPYIPANGNTGVTNNRTLVTTVGVRTGFAYLSGITPTKETTVNSVVEPSISECIKQ